MLRDKGDRDGMMYGREEREKSFVDDTIHPTVNPNDFR